jgi:hypothetical protein
MSKNSFGSTLFSFLTAFALLLEASGHMHDVISSLASSTDGEFLFVRSRFWLLRSRDKGNSWTPLRNPDDITWDEELGGSPNFVLSPNFKNDETILFGMYLSTDAGEVWSINLEEKLIRRKWSQVGYEICERESNPAVFSSTFTSDSTIFVVACQKEDPTVATLLYTQDFGKTFKPVKNLEPSKFGAWRPILTATSEEIYFQRTVGSDSEIFTPTNNPARWKKFATLTNFDIQSIGEDQRNKKGILVIDRGSNTLHRLSKDAVLTQITLPDTKTENSGDQFLVSAYNHKGEGAKTNLVVLRSTCPGRKKSLRQVGVACPKQGPDENDEEDYVLLSKDEGETWKKLTIVDWFYKQGGGLSLEFKLPEFTHVLGIPGTPTVFLGTFTGIYRSEDNGETWDELDTIALDVIGMNVGKITSDSAQLSLCTYDASCWSGVIDIQGLRNETLQSLPEGSLEQVVRLKEDIGEDETPGIFAYNTIAFSDGIGFLADKNGVMRYTDGFNNNYTRVESVDWLERSNVHGIRFSPNFENDDTVFIAGSSLGVYRSKDRGESFVSVFNATAQFGVSIDVDPVQLIVSPDFENDGLLFTYLTDGRIRQKQTEDPRLFISEDSGETWAEVNQGEDAPFLVSLALTINEGNAYSLIGIQPDGNVFVSSRKKGGQNKYGEWEPLRYRFEGSYTPVLPENKAYARKGYCHDSVLGATNGKLYMSLLTGGIAYGKLKGTRLTKPQSNGSEQRYRFGGTGQLLLKNFRKTYYEGLVEIEGVFFGVFFNEVWMSIDEGKTWTSVYKLASREPRFAGCGQNGCGQD